MGKTVSQSEYARQRGVTPGYINKLVRQGALKLQEGKIDPVQADEDLKAYAAQLHDTPGPKAVGQPDDDSLASWRKRELQVKTAIRQIQLDEEKGKLVNVDDLRQEFGKLFTDLKTTLRGLPSKVAGELYHTSKAAKTDRAGMAAVSTLLLKEIDAALTELSKWQPTKKGGGKGKKIGPYKRR